MFCLQCDELQFLNIFSLNQVAVLYSVDVLCLLCRITETIRATEGRMLASPVVDYDAPVTPLQL